MLLQILKSKILTVTFLFYSQEIINYRIVY